MLLLISDANILMDVEVGDLVAPMFSLGYEFAVPNVLYYEELEDQHAHLLDMGLQVRTLTDKGVGRVQSLSQTYSRPGRNDLFALALAESEQCPLLTGDAALRSADFRNGAPAAHHGRRRKGCASQDACQRSQTAVGCGRKGAE